MSIIQGNAHTSAGGGGFNVERSLRFNSADSAYLNRTPGSASNRKTWTWSAWVKRASLSTYDTLLFMAGPSAGDCVAIFWYNDNTFAVYSNGSSLRTTTQVFRDPSAWYHFVVAMDTTQATAANRIKLYVNGIEITVFGTTNNPTLNADLAVNNTTAHYIGNQTASLGFSYYSGYLTEQYLIDGSAKTPSDFGETDSATGVWKPKAYSGTYGTNGFYLKFADNSGTTSTTLGKDSSSNGNNWTPNNFSVTAGAGNDSLVDSPTAYGTDTGAGGSVRGNYATLNNVATGGTLTNGNLDYSSSTGTTKAAVGTIAVSSGKWYWEVTCTGSGGTFSNTYELGIANITSSYRADLPDSTSGAYIYYGYNGNKYVSGSGSSYGATYTTNDVIGFALDLDAGTLTCYKNNSSQGTLASSLSGTFFPIVSNGNSTSSVTVTCNFGQRAFAYTAPSGFKALCTTNLPTPTIGATSTTQANDYMNVVLYSGNSSTQNITGVGFAPDMVWLKVRNDAQSHRVFDTVRGASQRIVPNSTAAEANTPTELNAFGSDGFTLGNNTDVNGTGFNYVAWNWNAGGSNATNTAGTITSTVRANTTSGFSIVTYTGNGTAGATFGHGLGVAPSMIIFKRRNGVTDWQVYHVSVGNANTLYLNLTNASESAPGMLNSTTPTSTLITLGSGSNVNTNTATMLAYCFAPVAGYSAFGSYTGNGSTDGPFVYTNFRPRFVIIKNITTAGTSWEMFDSARESANLVDLELLANSSNAEGTYTFGDFVSNGFKLRSTNNGVNQSSATLIYMAFAENPFKYSLGR
jgi:hypothetical protein